MSCIGCYGPPPGIEDQGAQMIAALSALIDAGKEGTEAERQRRLESSLEGLADPAGTFYMFTLVKSLLGGRVRQ